MSRSARTSRPAWSERRNLRRLTLCAAAAACFTGVRIALVHLDPERGSLVAEELGLRSRSMAAPRGAIVDRGGRPLALSCLVYDVTLECHADGSFPEPFVDDLAELCRRNFAPGAFDERRLRSLFELPGDGRRHDLHARMRSRGREPLGPRWFWRRPLFTGLADYETLDMLRAFAKTRVDSRHRFFLRFDERWNRHYPLGVAAAHVVGMISEAADGSAKAIGLESLPVLASGEPLRLDEQRSAKGEGFACAESRLPLGSELARARVTTTLDTDLQEAAHAFLARAFEETGSRWGFLCLADLETGDLLALCGMPAYDPEQPAKDASFWPPTHQSLFEPGSVLKPLLFALAFELGVVRAGETIACEGDDGSRIWRLRRAQGRASRRIVDDHLVGRVSVERLLIESSNIGAVRVGQRGGPELHEKMLELFRLAEAPRLGLPLARRRGRVLRGQVPSSAAFADRRLYELYTGPSLSYGYECLLHPLTFAEAFASVVTGHAFRFRLVRGVTDDEGRVRRLAAAGRGRRVFSLATVGWLRSVLTRVVSDERGTARHIAGPGVSGVIAGKTGTSFVEDADGQRRYTASFCGFAPAAAPRYLAFCVLQRVGGRRFYGGKFAAPAVRDLLLKVLDRDAILGTGAAALPGPDDLRRDRR